MSSPQGSDSHGNGRPEANSNSWSQDGYCGLEEESYTSRRLRHASAHHLHLTSRRFFIGPIPEGWLQNHRKTWYKSRLRFRNYTSRTITFSVDPVATHYKQNSDRIAPPSLDPQAESDDEETESEQSNEPQDQLAVDSSSPLRMLSHETVGSAQEHSQQPFSDAAEISDSTEIQNNDPRNNSQEAASSYFTAREGTSPEEQRRKDKTKGKNNSSSIPELPDQGRPNSIASVSEADSSTLLLRSSALSNTKGKPTTSSTGALAQQEPQSEDTAGEFSAGSGGREEWDILQPLSSRVARFNLDDNILDKQQRLRAKMSRTHDNISSNRPHKRKAQKGAIAKAEKMLVRVEETPQTHLPDDYMENDSLKTETRIVDKWREYLVVCRKGSDEHTSFCLQMYKTRVIPEVQKPGSKKKPCHQVHLDHKTTRVNLYSPLDKTLVLWRPSDRGTKIYIIRPRSAAHSVEWYTFICQCLGWQRPKSLPISVPDLGVSLVFKNPFENLEPNSSTSTDQDGGAVKEEHFAASAIVRGCMKMLEGRSEWADVLKRWSRTEKMGLAWKRYDRLEWIVGVNAEKIYGSIAMQTSHELELRPRQHYSTAVHEENTKTEEPSPIEGFLIRLTSQKGVHQRLNKMFFKRLYFFTQDHYLLFCRPAKAMPPAPPRSSLDNNSDVPSAQKILDTMPTSFDVDPYTIADGEISWLDNGNQQHVQGHDEEAYVQFKRNIHNTSESDGFIDLCRVQEVRTVRRGSCSADPNMDQGPDIEFHPEQRDTPREDGSTNQFDDERTLELLLHNGLVVRLQAYNSSTRDEWMKRLDSLVKYWKKRTVADITELKAVRQRNLESLDIDEEMESFMGQFGRKWEVKKAVASPQIHNMCALSGCRTIKMSGQLYRKPKRRSTFRRCHLILTEGKLLIYHSALRKRNGTEIPSIHQEHEMTIDLHDCYIYSGLLTDSDLLYSNQTFDSNHPGHHALPRVYLASDAYTSSDEDTAISFVIWQPRRRNLFRAPEVGEEGQTKKTLRQVSALGVHGRSIVFKARSRVEKDRWVLSIASEIDRLQEEKPEDIRIVGP
ncbi:hypothetical protein ASPZODRAFT_72002 [Penicilliopsis zonata CBS 506.65]|uniref:PH domain-containing protein n=1 Tax=Penicilliopsis zonata CBS 506.65 TaxID=1073090 RepID=A0A1L9SBA4_9EURO|nr:hypothetical protein ASPZODRAFT_72002 [Penicilliopsis zonata CBS 506.65]OJJ44397.1 hypothetical protein ASPZODRAFT_72002 [Penicilliopsis zonata CBS 506.65]